MNDKVNTHDVAPAEDGEPLRFYWMRVRDYFYRRYMSDYIGDPCYYCHETFDTMESLDDAVWADNISRIAHTACYMKENVEPKRRLLPEGWYQDMVDRWDNEFSAELSEKVNATENENCANCGVTFDNSNKSDTMLYNGKKQVFEAVCFACEAALNAHIIEQVKENKNNNE